MKAAVFKEKGVFDVEDVPDPQIGPRDILVKISHCAICGSDVHRYANGMLKKGSVIGHEYAGARSTLHDSLQAVRYGGTAMVIAMAWEPVHCLPVDWIGREVQMKAAYGYLPSEWLPVMWLLETGQVRVSSMISEVVPLSDIQSAFQELLNPDTPWIQAVIALD